MRKTLSLSVVFALFLIFNHAEAAGNPGRQHPDGVTGRFNGWLSVSYADIFAEQGVAAADKNGFGIGMGCPLAGNVSIEAGYMLKNNDSTFHDYSLSARVYLKNPLKQPDLSNPDGAVWGPIVYARYSAKIPDGEPGGHRYRTCLAVLMPISRKLTLGAGWQYYQKENPRQVDEFFGLLNFFPKAYSPGHEFENPDGVEGSPSFSLRGGGSSRGFFGELGIFVPLDSRLTLALSVQGERVNSPDIRTAILGVKIYFYPGNS